MAGTYSGRRSGVNLSFYLEKLTQVDEPLLDIQDDTSLALFSNTSWFDFDMGQSLDGADGNGKGSPSSTAPLGPTINDEQMEFIKGMNLSIRIFVPQRLRHGQPEFSLQNYFYIFFR